MQFDAIVSRIVNAPMLEKMQYAVVAVAIFLAIRTRREVRSILASRYTSGKRKAAEVTMVVVPPVGAIVAFWLLIKYATAP